MREDLRYIESLIEDRDYSSHPSDEELADFIDNRLMGNTKDKVIEHLTHCSTCREVVNEVIEYKKKPKFFNNIINSTPLIALVASLIFFIILPSDMELIGKIDLSKSSIDFRGAGLKEEDKIIDGDKFIEEEIIASTDVTYIEAFIQAKEEKNFNKSLNLYQITINQISENEGISNREKLKQTIIIRRSILIRATTEDNKMAMDSYRDLLKEDIRKYYFNYYKEKR